MYDIPTETTVPFVISPAGANLSIDKIMNVPDPFSGSTTFTLQQNQPPSSPVNVVIKIYTSAGRLIQTVEKDGISQPLVTIPWNGMDREGNRLGNGVYLYKVIVKTNDGSQSATDVGRMAVLR